MPVPRLLARLLALAPLVTAASLFAQAPLSLDSAQSLTFSRIWYSDDSSPSAPPVASAQATVSVDPREVFALAREAWAPDSLLHAYLNIWVADRWIVQNRVLDEVALAALEGRPPGEPGTGDFVYSYTFRLEGTLPGEPVLGDTESLEAYAEVRVSPGGAAGPPTLFAHVVEAEVRPLTCFDPDDDLLDALDDDDDGEPPAFPDSDPAVPALPPEKVPERVEHVTQAAGNLQAAKNQCGPMAVANSLAYLDERFELGVPHEHKQGQGTGGDDSLVGELDRATGRGVTDRANGDPLRGDSLVRGKFKYLADNGLNDRLAHEHRGLLVDEFGDSGDFTAHGSTSVRTGAREDITWEWLCDRLKAGADVEIEFVTNRSRDRIGTHMVRVIGCGEEGEDPDKKRWIRYVDDSVQGDDTNKLSVTETYVTQAADGRLKIFPYGEIFSRWPRPKSPLMIHCRACRRPAASSSLTRALSAKRPISSRPARSPRSSDASP